MGDEAKAKTSTPPLDDGYVRKTLAALKVGQAAQATIEAERTGASKMTSRLLGIFGTLITAAAVGGFGLVWNAQAANTRQDSEISRISEKQNEHDPSPPGHEAIVESVGVEARRVDGVERATKTINSRLDRMETKQKNQHDEVMAELRRLRSARRTWGGR